MTVMMMSRAPLLKGFFLKVGVWMERYLWYGHKMSLE